MMRFSVTSDFDAACIISSETVSGEVYRVDRPNGSAGATFTPVALFFAWRAVHTENFHPHWRVDCFVRAHQLSPDLKDLGIALAEGLLREAISSEPLWVSWHRSEELGG
jgi:hypothetical protein